MTITGRIDPRHAATFSGACPKCGARWDERRTCSCGNEQTWRMYVNDCIARGDGPGITNAILAGFAGAQGGGAA